MQMLNNPQKLITPYYMVQQDMEYLISMYTYLQVTANTYE